MDKEIIIDGVDVEKCLHRRFRHKIDICYRCAAYTNGFMGYCEDYSNCYYKQLKRKEQDCKGLQCKLEVAKGTLKEFARFRKYNSKTFEFEPDKYALLAKLTLDKLKDGE